MGNAHVKVFGALRTILDKQGMDYEQEVDMAPGGIPAVKVVEKLGIPVNMVEAVFRNGKIINIYDMVYPGDRIGLFPFGTPGPYRVFLGMLRENAKRKELEKRAKKGA